MSNDYSVAETKDKLTNLLRMVEAGDHVHITRRGKPVAVLLSTREFLDLTSRPRCFMEALRRFEEDPDAGEAVIDDDFLDGLRDRSPGRESRR